MPKNLLGTIAILGYGNQGRAQALNLRDSGAEVIIGQREGKSAEKARDEGFPVLPVSEAVAKAKTLMLTLPDETMGSIYKSQIEPFLTEGQTLLFSHGFAIRFGTIVPPKTVHIGLVSPKGQAAGVRGRYLEGKGVPALIAAQPADDAHALAVCKAYAELCGYARTLLIPTSFAEETETDLFGEQAVLCGGVIELVKTAFEVLVEAGYSKESAYFEVFHELKLIVDLMNREGLGNMRKGISDTAEWGGYLSGPKLVTLETKEAMKAILSRIQSGEFAQGWVQEAEQNQKKRLLELRAQEAAHPIEEVGEKLRPKIL